jgi:hypothetical protein
VVVVAVVIGRFIPHTNATAYGVDASVSITGITGSPGAWNSDGILVVVHDALLPQYCVKCGGPTNEPPLKRNFSWHPQWYAVLIFFGLLPFLIMALVGSKRMVVQIPLCAKHLERYKGLRLASILLLLGGIPEMTSAATWLPEDLQGFDVFVGILALLAGLFCLSFYLAVLRPKYIDKSFGYFRNAHANFLSLLPALPQNVPPYWRPRAATE